MERYPATRLLLRTCAMLMAASIGTVHGQVQVGELMVSPAPDGVTVAIAPAPLSQPPQPPQPVMQEIVPVHPENTQPDAQADTRPIGQPVAHDIEAPLPAMDEPAPARRPAVTRITLAPGDLPPPQPRVRPQALRTPEMVRDVQTLKAARAAMALDDRLRERRMAALR